MELKGDTTNFQHMKTSFVAVGNIPLSQENNLKKRLHKKKEKEYLNLILSHCEFFLNWKYLSKVFYFTFHLWLCSSLIIVNNYLTFVNALANYGIL